MAVGYKLIYITAPTEVVGYHMANAYGTGEPIDDLPNAETFVRFWLQTANTDNYLPDRVVPNSDTADVTGSGVFEYDIGYTSPNMLPCDLVGGDYTFDFMLPNPVRLDVPGMYWIGWGHDSYGEYGGGNLRASTVVGMQRGLCDLHFVGATPTNAQGPSYTGWEIPDRLTDEGVEIMSDSDLWSFIDIWLICQQLTPEVPYGG